MLNKLKLKLKEWLFKDELQQLQVLKNDYGYLHDCVTASRTLLSQSKDTYDNATKELKKATDNCSQSTIQLSEALDVCNNLQCTINDVCDVGVDVGLYEDYHNWAVVCVHGKTEFIKFVPIAQQDIYTIRNFLKQFEYCKDRMRVDSPFGYREICAPWLSKNKFR